jgi:hypothetical protein
MAHDPGCPAPCYQAPDVLEAGIADDLRGAGAQADRCQVFPSTKEYRRFMPGSLLRAA